MAAALDDWARARELAKRDGWQRLLLQPGFEYIGWPALLLAIAGLALLARRQRPTGLAYFVGLLRQGRSRFNVVRALAATPEAKLTEVARWLQDQYGWARTLGDLKRDPADNYWAGFLGDS